MRDSLESTSQNETQREWTQIQDMIKRCVWSSVAWTCAASCAWRAALSHARSHTLSLCVLMLEQHKAQVHGH